MELNKTQLLVHDDEDLERFRAKHNIPGNVHIERPGSNEVAHLVEGNDDSFPPRKEPGTPFFLGNHYLRHRNSCQPHTRRNPVVRAIKARVPALPIFILSSENEHSDDLAYAPLQPAGEVKIFHSFREAHDSGTSSEETNMLAADSILALNDAVIGVGPSSSEAPFSSKQNGKETVVGSSRRSRRRTGGTSLAFLPSLDMDTELWKPEFAAIELGGQSLRAGDNYDRQVAELHPRMYMKRWLACLAELGIPADNLAWSNPALGIELPKSPEPYSPMILPGFNEEEFMNRPNEEDGEEALENEATQSIGVTTQLAKEPSPSAEKVVQPEEGVEKVAIEDAAHDPSLEP
ncbi:hypothetical protein Acr_02g0011280 [Actinidia rufa]|uniref:Uncharacterized protein n=1 Tax=Actinidia rufa TaxID=165716 RepID=A0A7J0E8U9_9ERIC|nr:hypothetical protein Acr_02g0011280 [Actinidia rufa]